MSEENAELARQAFEAFNRRDLGAYLALMDADVEAGSLLVALEGRRSRPCRNPPLVDEPALGCP